MIGIISGKYSTSCAPGHLKVSSSQNRSSITQATSKKEAQYKHTCMHGSSTLQYLIGHTTWSLFSPSTTKTRPQLHTNKKHCFPSVSQLSLELSSNNSSSASTFLDNNYGCPSMLLVLYATESKLWFNTCSSSQNVEIITLKAISSTMAGNCTTVLPAAMAASFSYKQRFNMVIHMHTSISAQGKLDDDAYQPGLPLLSFCEVRHFSPCPRACHPAGDDQPAVEQLRTKDQKTVYLPQ